MSNVRLTDLIAPSFYGVHDAIKRELYTHYWLKGGRGSTKSSFVSAEKILGIMKHPDANGVALRRYGNTLQDSVYTKLLWAIDTLGVGHLWHNSISPMRLTYKPTGQMVLFRGADDPSKVQSINLRKGYLRYIWYEEVKEFPGMESIRNLNESFMRGGDKFDIFYTYNPPKAMNNWVNEEARIPRSDRLIHHSTYETVPKAWLGAPFLYEAEHLKAVNPKAYEHEYGGEVTGTGGEIFENVKLQAITPEEIKSFDNIRRGIDWGYAVDPFAYLVMQYDRTRRKLYIYREIYQVKLSNRAAADMIKKENPYSREITADSAEPKSINDMRMYGLRVTKARKGPDSVDFGIKWLQDLEEIIIDPDRCPNTAREFCNYELEPDQFGGFKAGYPDKDNHTIDAARYACENDMRQGIGPVNVRL